MRVSQAGSCLDVCRGRARRAVGDVVPDRGRKQQRILEHHANLGAQRSQGIVADITAVDEHAPLPRVVETE